MPETVGFTGTRLIGMPDLAIIRRIVEALPDGTQVVTGACIGVDAAVARVAYRRGLPVHAIVPADRSRVDPRWREFCTTFEEMPPGTTYRERNTRIVERSAQLQAIPAHLEHDPESRRSGSWQTVRIARKNSKPVDVTVLCHDCARRAAEAGAGAGEDE